MAELTGYIIKERYALGKKDNSFYEKQKTDTKVGKEYITGEPEIVYYVDKKTGRLKAQETMLLW